jgi:hypothetical protein
MACPTITFLIGSNSTHAVPGGPVIAQATPGVPPALGFGANGAVSLECGTQRRAIPSELTYWSNTLVVFTLPTDLAPCGSVWKAVFQIGTDRCLVDLFITFPVINPLAPKLLAVFPIPVQAESSFDLTGLGFGSNPDVRVPTLEGMYAFLNIAANATDLHVTAYAPTIRALQTAGSYHRNQLTLTLDTVVVNRNNQAAPQLSNPLPVIYYLPPPRPGAAAIKGDTVYFGRPNEPDYPDAGDAEWLGGPEHGSVRLYLSDPSAQILPLLSLVKSTVVSANTPVEPGTASKLSDIRQAGTELLVDNGKWHEESIIAHLPPHTTTGFVVVWRDDIPSVPSPFVRAPVIPCQSNEIEQLVKEVFVLQGAPPQTVPLGGLLDLSVSPVLENNAPKVNDLTEALRLIPGAQIQFGFRLKKNGQDASAGDVHAVQGKPSPPGGFEATERLKCKFLPALFADTGTSQGDSWMLTVEARVTLPPCVGNPFVVKLDEVIFIQNGLRVPSVAIFFEHQNYAGDPLVVLPPNTSLAPLQGKYYDDDHLKGNLTLARSLVSTMLGGFLSDLNLIADFASVLGSLLPGAAALVAVGTAANTVLQANHPIIDATGKIDNLADRLRVDLPGPWNNDYDNLISSMVLVSIPQGLTFNTWKDEGRQGRHRDFRMPSGRLVATITDFHNLLDYTDTVSPLVLSTRESNYNPNEEDEYNDCVTVIDVM